MNLRILDIINDPLSYFLRAVLGSAFHLNLRGTYILIKRSIYGLTDKGTFILKSKVFIEHRHRENLCQRIGNVQALCLWPTAVDRFKDGSTLTVRISPKVFSVTITSKNLGSVSIFIAALSTNI